MRLRDWAGRDVCQVRGCDEPAMPWGVIIDVDEYVVVEVLLCRRHDGLLFASSSELAEHEAST